MDTEEGMKILNLYCGLGGNRKLWEDVEVTGVELNPSIAEVYNSYYPDDTIIVGDAHQYLLDHHAEFDFIWSSPPCPSHSRINTDGNHAPRFPDMKLYEEILFLGNNWYKGKWVVENVIPYYRPLIPAKEIDRHLFWSNFRIGNFTPKDKPLSIAHQTGTTDRFGFNLKGVKIDADKRQCMRNLVNPEVGLYILNCARDIITKENQKQISLFDKL
jgi:DNA (cytosine-5)-methyltransferase 1